MIPANIINLDPQRIKEKECEVLERDKKLFNFLFSLSKSERQLVRDFLKIDWKEDVAGFVSFIKALSDEEMQVIKKTVDVLLHSENMKPCKVIHLQAK